MALFEHFAKKSEETLYTIFRIIVGALYGMHGLMKLGVLSGGFSVNGFFGFLGICEVIIGLGILTGILTRLAALGGIIIMLGAIITVHLPMTLNPLGKGGAETPLLFLAAFLILFAMSVKKCGLDKKIFGKEIF